jgi:LAO/AO transport system kinase
VNKKTSSDNLGALLKRARSGDMPSWAQLLTRLEKMGPREAFKELPNLLEPQHGVFRVGITGPPGAGKSTLINQLLTEFRKKDLSIGVLAVDPSSPFSKGAILGDRVRYSEHFLDEKIFIRSIGTRGSLGGLSGSAYLMLRAFDLMPFDLVIIETVGVGQTELEIVNVADQVSVVFVPESGDGIQTMKAGLTEIANLFIVNKKDRPGADAIKLELETQMQFSGGEVAQVLMTNSLDGEGVQGFAAAILNAKSKWNIQSRAKPERLRAEMKALLRVEVEADLDKRLSKMTSLNEM